MNSNHSTYTAPLLRRLCQSVLLAASLLVLGACHSSMTPTQEEIDATCPRTVRIMAAVEGYAGTHAGTRAVVDAVVDNTSTDHDTFEKLTKEAQGGEKAIRDIFLFVVPEFGSEASQVIYYYGLGDDSGITGDKLNRTNVVAKSFTTNNDGEAVMELALKPGRYTFITIANSVALRKAAKEKGTVTLSALRGLTHTNRTFVARPDQTEVYIGNSSKHQDFPILGQQVITVPSEAPTKPFEPVINMERIFARVDLFLTTTESKGGEYLQSHVDEDDTKTLRRPSDYRLKGMRLLAATTSGYSYPYPILPSAGEYTALEEVIRSVGYTSPTILKDKGITSNGEWEDGSNPSESQAWDKVINNGKDGGLGKLWHTPLFYTKVWNDTNENPYHLYLPSLYLGQVTDKNKSIRLELQFKKLDGSETLTYRIPIHNETGASDYYSIRRNTIYDIDLTFYGSKLVVKQSNAKYTVDTWEDQPVDIPW